MLKISLIGAFVQLGCAQSAFAASVKGEYLFEIGGFGITNSMATTWVFAIIIILLFRFLIRGGAKLIPSNGQLVIETIVESLSSILEPVMGQRAFKAAFPLLLGFFSYILLMNWSGILPGVGSIGLEKTVDGAEKFVLYFVMKYAGPKAFLHDTFGNKADKNDVALPIYISLFAVFFAVGCIDLISIIMRLLSLSFRLYGNCFGGEVLLDNMHNIAISLPRFFSWIIPIPFYFLEFLIGLIQAFLFTLLTAVYIGLLTAHEE